MQQKKVSARAVPPTIRRSFVSYDAIRTNALGSTRGQDELSISLLAIVL